MLTKGQTEQERSDRVEDVATKEARTGQGAINAATSGSMGAFKDKT